MKLTCQILNKTGEIQATSGTQIGTLPEWCLKESALDCLVAGKLYELTHVPTGTLVLRVGNTQKEVVREFADYYEHNIQAFEKAFATHAVIQATQKGLFD